MADTDCGHIIDDNRIGNEGKSFICPNGLKIIPDIRQGIDSKVYITPLTAVGLSGTYHERWDDYDYYT
jgi:hypothetical protein